MSHGSTPEELPTPNSAAPVVAPPPPWRFSRLWPWLLCLAVVLMIHHPLIFSGFARAQPDTCDTRLVNYFMEHTWQTLTGRPHHDSLWQMPFFYPQDNVGAYSDVVVALSPPYLVFRLCGIPPDLAFQLWLVTMTLLNFGLFYYFLRTGFVLESMPAAFGAALFAAGAPRINQLTHPQMYSHLFVLLALIALSRLFAAAPDSSASNSTPAPRGSAAWWRTTGWLALLFGAGLAQCYGGFYNAFFLLLFLAVAGITALGLAPLRRRLVQIGAHHWPSLLMLTGLSCALLAPMYLHYHAVAVEQGMRGWPEIASMLPRPESWFYLGRDSWLFGKLALEDNFYRLPMNHEHRLGIGLLTV